MPTDEEKRDVEKVIGELAAMTGVKGLILFVVGDDGSMTIGSTDNMTPIARTVAAVMTPDETSLGATLAEAGVAASKKPD